MKRVIITTLLLLAVALVPEATSAEPGAEPEAQTGPLPSITHVKPGQNLQGVLNAAKRGDTITLEAGGVYGPIRLPKIEGSEYITLRSAATLAERRLCWNIDPAVDTVDMAGCAGLTGTDLSKLARIQTTQNGTPAITTEPGAHHWRLIGLDVTATAGNVYGIIRCGSADGYSSLDQVPHHIEFDRIYVHISDEAQERRGLQTHCSDMLVTRSVIRGIKEEGADSQVIGGWEGVKGIRLLDNLFDGGTETVLFGAAPSSKVTPVPEDIEVRGNTIRRPASQRGSRWQVKNLLELKSCRRCVVAENVIENNWPAAQSGFAILLTARGGPSYPWAVLEDIVFEHNVVRNTASGLNILGYDDEGKAGTLGRRITVRHNLFVINRASWGGEGSCYMVLGSPHDTVLDHNTCISDGPAVLRVSMARQPPATGFRYTNNVSLHGEYGVVGDSTAVGRATIEKFFVDAVVTRNVLAANWGAPYPAGNLFPSLATYQAQFVNLAGGDYRLKDTSTWKGAGTDGLDLGADMTKLPRTR